MADLENGLPPQGADISDKQLNVVLIDKSDAEDSEISGISLVMVEKQNAEDSEIPRISVISIDTSPAGRNWATFL
ncbi:hypothetical protein [Prevotella sp. 10(H)]|uniref:hypothetical protein n=1 Tax=Prevotella sp. 10(H) TaxID=1158294 RepID=UPI0004A71BB0|nr:hypothetical protein [Prevotella sp. 10(H)]